MSVIHEALKRAEQERASGLAPRPADPGTASATPARRRRSWVVAALVVSILLPAGWYWAEQRDRPRGVRPDSRVAEPEPAAPLMNRHTTFRPAEPVAAVPAPERDGAPGVDPDPGRLNSRAVAAFRGGRAEEARLLLEQALRLAPALPEAHNNLGLVLRSQGLRAEAREEFLRALALSPGYPEALNNLGLAWVEEGNQSEAIRFFEKALSARPGYSSAHLNLAIVYDRQGKRTDAFYHYRRFLEGAGADERELASRVNERLRR